MKECVSCHQQVEDHYPTCPHCGGGGFIQTAASSDDALSMLAGYRKRAEAAEHVDRGGRLYTEKRYDDAIAEFKKAIEINPHNAPAHGNIGVALFEQGKNEEAIPWLKKALELDPNIEGVGQVLKLAQGKGSGSNQCFIATACYGSPDCEEVLILRRFRDEILLQSWTGTFIVKWYYRLSPRFAEILSSRPRLRSLFIKLFLGSIVRLIQRGDKDA